MSKGDATLTADPSLINLLVITNCYILPDDTTLPLSLGHAI